MSVTTGRSPEPHEPVSTDQGNGLFVRNATGLVREMSQRDNFILAALAGAPAAFVALTIFFVLGGLPGGNVFLGGLLCIPIVLAFSFSFGMMTSAIPRSGGDYTIVSRVLGPRLGLISSFCMVLGGFALSGAGLGKLFDVLGFAPSLQTVGVVAHSHSLFKAGTTMLNSKGWQFGLGCLMFVIGALVHLGGPRAVKRVLGFTFFASTAGLLFCALVAIFTSKSTFAHQFNSLAHSYTGTSDAYDATINAAQKAGVNLHPGLSLAATIPVIGVFATSSIYTYFGSFAAGELRKAATRKTAFRMAGGGIFSVATVLLVIALLFGSWGKPFITAAFGGGFPASLGTLPAYFTLTSFQLHSTIISVILCLTFLCVFPMFAVQQLLGLTRILFAWSFDGILPERVSRVSSRTHAPTDAVVICLLVYVASCAWGVWDATGIIQIIVYATVIQLIAMMLVGVAAVVFPRRHPELYRASGVTAKVGSLPLVSVAGFASIIGGAFVIFLFFHYSFFGLTDKGKFFIWAGSTIVAALLYYFVVRALRARRGVDLSLVYAEIPPE